MLIFYFIIAVISLYLLLLACALRGLSYPCNHVSRKQEKNVVVVVVDIAYHKR